MSFGSSESCVQQQLYRHVFSDKIFKNTYFEESCKEKNDWMRILKTYAPYRINVLDGT